LKTTLDHNSIANGNLDFAYDVLDNAREVLVLDNLYSLKAWVTCTSHVHEDTSLKTRQIKVKKTRYKIINQLTHFINEPLHLNFVTVISPVRRLKKLVSYYLII